MLPCFAFSKFRNVLLEIFALVHKSEAKLKADKALFTFKNAFFYFLSASWFIIISLLYSISRMFIRAHAPVAVVCRAVTLYVDPYLY
jgi:membrane-associated phospholipid phosphatase